MMKKQASSSSISKGEEEILFRYTVIGERMTQKRKLCKRKNPHYDSSQMLEQAAQRGCTSSSLGHIQNSPRQDHKQPKQALTLSTGSDQMTFKVFFFQPLLFYESLTAPSRVTC